LALRDLEAFSPAERRDAERYLTAQAQALADGEYFRHFLGYRVFNHVLMAAVGLDYVGRRLLGEVPSAWDRLIAAVRADVLAIGVPLENASNYEPLSLHMLLQWETFREEDRYLATDPRVRDTFERSLQLLSPVGVMPEYGDSSWNPGWGLWITAFEGAGRLYGDGRFRWAAGEIFDYQLRTRETWLHGADFLPGLRVWETAVLTYAADQRDDALPPQPPVGGTALVYRHLPHNYYETLTPISGAPAVYPPGPGERRQDKLVFRGGWGREAPYALVELQQRLWHDHGGAPALTMLSVGDSVLVCDNGYWQDWPEFHNTFFLQPAGDVRPFAAGMLPGEGHGLSRGTSHNRELGKPFARSVDDFSSASFADLHTVPYLAYPAEHRRALAFSKRTGVLLVWDRIRVWEGAYEAGPLVHTQEITERLPGGFVSQIDRLHDHHAGWTPNDPRRLVTAFWAADGEVGAVQQRSFETPESREEFTFACPWCLYCRQTVSAGEQAGFLTLLLPLGAGEGAPTLVGSADGESAVVTAGNLTVGFSAGSLVTSGPVTTDAAAFLCEEDGERLTVAFTGASHLDWAGRLRLQVGELQLDNSLYEQPPRVSGELAADATGVSLVLHSMIAMTIQIDLPIAAGPVIVDGEPLASAVGPWELTVAGRLELCASRQDEA
jgi:hypothetical protein